MDRVDSNSASALSNTTANAPGALEFWVDVPPRHADFMSAQEARDKGLVVELDELDRIGAQARLTRQDGPLGVQSGHSSDSSGSTESNEQVQLQLAGSVRLPEALRASTAVTKQKATKRRAPVIAESSDDELALGPDRHSDRESQSAASAPALQRTARLLSRSASQGSGGDDAFQDARASSADFDEDDAVPAAAGRARSSSSSQPGRVTALRTGHLKTDPRSTAKGKGKARERSEELEEPVRLLGRFSKKPSGAQPSTSKAQDNSMEAEYADPRENTDDSSSDSAHSAKDQVAMDIDDDSTAHSPSNQSEQLDEQEDELERSQDERRVILAPGHEAHGKPPRTPQGRGRGRGRVRGRGRGRGKGRQSQSATPVKSPLFAESSSEFELMQTDSDSGSEMSLADVFEVPVLENQNELPIRLCHNLHCAKASCGKQPADRVLADIQEKKTKRKGKRRKTRDDLDADTDDDIDEAKGLGAFLKCSNCCQSYHFGCMTSTQRNALSRKLDADWIARNLPKEQTPVPAAEDAPKSADASQADKSATASATAPDASAQARQAGSEPSAQVKTASAPSAVPAVPATASVAPNGLAPTAEAPKANQPSAAPSASTAAATASAAATTTVATQAQPAAAAVAAPTTTAATSAAPAQLAAASTSSAPVAPSTAAATASGPAPPTASTSVPMSTTASASSSVQPGDSALPKLNGKFISRKLKRHPKRELVIGDAFEIDECPECSVDHGACIVCRCVGKRVALDPFSGFEDSDRPRRFAKFEPLPSLMFRCRECRRAAHYECLPNIDKEANDMAQHVARYIEGGLCHQCLTWDGTLEAIFAWRISEGSEQAVSEKDAIARRRDESGKIINIPKPKVPDARAEYLVKWRGRSYLHIEWLPHTYVTNRSRMLLGTFLTSGPRIRFDKADLQFDDEDADTEEDGAADSGRRKRGAQAGSASEDKEKGLGPDIHPLPDPDAEKRVPEAWRTVDRVLEVWFASKSEPDKLLPYENVKRHLPSILEHQLSLIREAKLKWIGLPYSDSTEEPPPPETDPHYEDFVNAYRRFVDARAPAMRIPHLNSSQLETFDRKIRTERLKLITADQSGLTGRLHDFQVTGANFMLQRWWATTGGAILADEMGLGKTIQVIALISHLCLNLKAKPFLIVVPNSVLGNWTREFAKWAPAIRTIPYGGLRDSLKVIEAFELFPNATRDLYGHVVITTYETALANATTLRKVARWELVIVDEAQRLKGGESKKLTKALNELTFRTRILLTGTPLNNNVTELFHLLSFIDYDSWPNPVKAAKEFETLTPEKVEEIRNILRPYMLRRTKEQVLDLPPLIETIVPVTMTNLQRSVYRSVISKNLTILRALTSAVSGQSLRDPSKKRQSRFILMELRKLLCHPYLVDGALEPAGVPPAETQKNLIEASAKLILLNKLLPALQAGGHRTLLFSQFKIALDIVEDFLVGKGINFVRIDGDTPGPARVVAIDKFQAPDSDISVFLVTTRAGGVGINLTAADTVILHDSDFNPQQDLQAIARAHRIGQTRPVRVFRIQTQGTVEERILQRAQRKLGLDHVIIQRIDADDEEEDVLNLLSFGAQDIFKDDATARQITYDDEAVKKLANMEPDAKAREKKTGPADTFANPQVFSAETGALEIANMDEDASRQAGADFWADILEQTTKKGEANQEEEPLDLELVGRKSKRTRAPVNYYAEGSPEKKSKKRKLAEGTLAQGMALETPADMDISDRDDDYRPPSVSSVSSDEGDAPKQEGVQIGPHLPSHYAGVNLPPNRLSTEPYVPLSSLPPFKASMYPNVISDWHTKGNPAAAYKSYPFGHSAPQLGPHAGMTGSAGGSNGQAPGPAGQRLPNNSAAQGGSHGAAFTPWSASSATGGSAPRLVLPHSGMVSQHNAQGPHSAARQSPTAHSQTSTPVSAIAPSSAVSGTSLNGMASTTPNASAPTSSLPAPQASHHATALSVAALERARFQASMNARLRQQQHLQRSSAPNAMPIATKARMQAPSHPPAVMPARTPQDHRSQIPLPPAQSAPTPSISASGAPPDAEAQPGTRPRMRSFEMVQPAKASPGPSVTSRHASPLNTEPNGAGSSSASMASKPSTGPNVQQSQPGNATSTQMPKAPSPPRASPPLRAGNAVIDLVSSDSDDAPGPQPKPKPSSEQALQPGQPSAEAWATFMEHSPRRSVNTSSAAAVVAASSSIARSSLPAPVAANAAPPASQPSTQAPKQAPAQPSLQTSAPAPTGAPTQAPSTTQGPSSEQSYVILHDVAPPELNESERNLFNHLAQSLNNDCRKAGIEMLLLQSLEHLEALVNSHHSRGLLPDELVKSLLARIQRARELARKADEQRAREQASTVSQQPVDGVASSQTKGKQRERTTSADTGHASPMVGPSTSAQVRPATQAPRMGSFQARADHEQPARPPVPRQESGQEQRCASGGSAVAQERAQTAPMPARMQYVQAEMRQSHQGQQPSQPVHQRQHLTPQLPQQRPSQGQAEIPLTQGTQAQKPAAHQVARQELLPRLQQLKEQQQPQQQQPQQRAPQPAMAPGRSSQQPGVPTPSRTPPPINTLPTTEVSNYRVQVDTSDESLWILLDTGWALLAHKEDYLWRLQAGQTQRQILHELVREKQDDLRRARELHLHQQRHQSAQRQQQQPRSQPQSPALQQTPLMGSSHPPAPSTHAHPTLGLQQLPTAAAGSSQLVRAQVPLDNIKSGTPEGRRIESLRSHLPLLAKLGEMRDFATKTGDEQLELWVDNAGRALDENDVPRFEKNMKFAAKVFEELQSKQAPALQEI